MKNAALSLLLAAQVQATSYTWRGIIDNQWTVPNNWEPATTAFGPGDVPSDVVTIDDNEGKNAVVELSYHSTDNPPVVKSKSLQVLNLGDKLGIHATLRILTPLSVSQALTVQPNGVIIMGAADATVQAGTLDCQGEFHFYGGRLYGGKVKIHGPGLADFGSTNQQGAKVFDGGVTVNIGTSKSMTAGGLWKFGTNSTIDTTAAVVATGPNMQLTLVDAAKSTGYSFTSPSFSWQP